VAESVKDDQDFLREAKELFETAQTAWNPIYASALDDLKFVAGDQWDAEALAERREDGRPVVTVNKLHKFVKRVHGEQRMNRVEPKVIPVGNSADVKTAHTLQACLRYIERNSNAEYAYENGGTYQLACSIGFWRVITEYKDNSFERDIKVKTIENPFTVLIDPSFKEPDGSDIKYAFINEWMSKKDFKRAYPDVDGLDSGSEDTYTSKEGWFETNRVRICEYYYKDYYKKKLAMTSVGEVFTFGKDEEFADEKALLEAGYEVVETRTVDAYKVKWCKFTGSKIIMEPQTLDGKYIPIIASFGDSLNIEGEKKLLSLIRFAKDPQMVYNYFNTAATEAVAMQPKTPWIISFDQIKGFEQHWAEAHRKNRPYLPYNYIPGQTKPDRISPPTVPTGAFATTGNANADIMDVIGIYQASLGQPSNERSGKAILARQQEADAGIYTFIDNHSRALVHTARVIIDLLPYTFDTERILHIVSDDNEVQQLEINKTEMDVITGETFTVNDITEAMEYGVLLTVGPSYLTKRREIAQSMLEFIQFFPQAGPIIAPMLAKHLDWPEAEKVAKIMQLLLPPQIQQALGGQPQMPQLPGGPPGQPGQPMQGQPPPQMPQQMPLPMQ
jgi:hypothetical protein